MPSRVTTIIFTFQLAPGHRATVVARRADHAGHLRAVIAAVHIVIVALRVPAAEVVHVAVCRRRPPRCSVSRRG
jgi:hypothetical protein